MAKARAIVKRRKAVRNIRKITQTMQLIATARFQRCLQRAVAGKPYTARISEMIETLARSGSVDHALFKTNAGVTKSILLVITANRGLCGAYNASVLRAGVQRRDELLRQGLKPDIEMVGKKGAGYMRFIRQPLAGTITDVEDRIAYARVSEMADRYMDLYASGQVARVDVVYMRFETAGVQRPTVAQLLPIEPPAGPSTTAARGVQPVFEFSPPPGELLARLMPETVRIRLYQYFNDAIVSEQIARMVAMKAATEAAGDMIKNLTRTYNRARQTQITMELLDIVGGAEAIK